MIFDVNEENLELLVTGACPIDFQSRNSNNYCMLLDDDVYYVTYNGSVVDTCRACWLEWLSAESKGV